MLKATVSVTKKRPAIEDYSSDMFHASIEVELPETVFTNGNGDLRDNLAKMFTQVEAQVDAQITGKKAPVEDKPPVNKPATKAPVTKQAQKPQDNGGNRAGANSYTEPVASSKQIGFLVSLAKRNRGMGPADITRLVKDRFNKIKVYDLSTREASSLIDELKAAS